MKLLLDTSIAAPAREALIAAGHDVTVVGNRAKGNIPTDADVLDQAARDGRILVTLDKTLGEHELIRGRHCPMLRLGGFKVTEQAAAILQVLAAFGEEIARGAVVTVEPGQLKVRPFPDARDAN